MGTPNLNNPLSWALIGAGSAGILYLMIYGRKMTYQYQREEPYQMAAEGRHLMDPITQ
jgi:hypothetical protein